MCINILIAESLRFSERAAGILAEAGNLTLADLDREGLLASVRNSHVLWVRLRHQIDREVMEAAPNLQIIATPTTGLNHIDLGEAERRGIRVVSLRNEYEFLKNVYATAEHTITLILALFRNLPGAVSDVVRGGWDRDSFRGRELHGKTAGIVGYGRIGRMVARYLAAFGVRVIATDPAVRRDQAESGVSMQPLPGLLEQADLVSLHVNLEDRTAGFFGRTEFAMMKPGSWFINTARGELVDEQALLDALSSGHLAGAALDVLTAEASSGMSRHPLVKYSSEHSNLIITPHIAGCTAESMEKTEIFLAERVAAVLATLPSLAEAH